MAASDVVRDCLHLEKAEGGSLWFSSAGEYLKHLLQAGFTNHAVLRPVVPVAAQLKPSPLPNINSLSTEAAHSDSEESQSGRLLDACMRGLPTALQLVLNNSHNLDLNTSLVQGLSPLAVVAIGNAPSCCELLIAAGAKVNWSNETGRSALHWAVLAGQLPSVQLLMKHGASLTSTDGEGFTPLMYATLTGGYDIAAAILKTGSVPVDYPHQPTGVTPLMSACAQAHTELAKLLLKHRADPSLCDNHGHSALHSAIWGGSLKCVKLILAQSGAQSLQAARDRWGKTPFLVTTSKGDVGICQYLLKKGSRWNEVDNEGRSPLHWAVLSLQPSCVEFILEHRSGAGSGLINQPDSSGATPTHYAAMIGNEKMLSLFLAKGATMTLRDGSGHTPLLWAAACGKVGVTRQLLGLIDGGSPTTEEKEEMLQPLHVASCVGAVDVCQVLVEGGAKVNVGAPGGQTPLHFACQFGHLDTVGLLLSNGAHMDSLTLKQETGLHLATVHGHAPVVDELLNRGADKDRALGPSGNRPVHLASLNGHAKVLEVLLNHGCSVDTTRPTDLRTSLHLSAAGGHLGCCQTLVERGADTRLRDKTTEGFTALDLAMIGDHSDCSAFLITSHTPSGGGSYHRAALTIQAVWRFHRRKRRWSLARQWAAMSIQRAVREWLCRRRAGRVRNRRESARNRAAATIQHHWRLYISEKRRYESTYARLKARLEQERLATGIILSELQSQAQSVRLPSTVKSRSFSLPTPSSPNPRYLLQASTTPLPIFPSGSLLFPSKPRKPLLKRPPTITVVERNETKPSVLFAIPELGEEGEGEEEKLPSLTSRGRLPPIPQTSSLTSPPVPVSAKTSECHPKGSSGDVLRTSSKRSRARFHKAQKLDSHDEIAARPSTSGNDCKSEYEPLSRETSSPELNITQTLESHTKLPPILEGGGMVCEGSEALGTELSSARGVPSSEKVTSLPPLSSPGGDDGTRGRAMSVLSEPVEQVDGSGMGEVADLLGLEGVQNEGGASAARVPMQSYITRQSTFKDAPLGYRPVQQGRGAGKSAVPADQRLVLQQVQRYDKLNQVLSLLNRAKEGQRKGEGGGEGEVKMRDLKHHIETALDEAIRLRADTEVLEARTGGLQAVL